MWRMQQGIQKAGPLVSDCIAMPLCAKYINTNEHKDKNTHVQGWTHVNSQQNEAIQLSRVWQELLRSAISQAASRS